MSDVVLFISEDRLKETSYLDENVDVKLIKDVIELCQDKYILPLLGTALYNEVADKIDNDQISGSYETLLENYIHKALKWYVLYEGIPTLTYKFMNKSIVKKNSENSSPIDTEEVTRLMDNFRNNAEMFAQRLTSYLIANNTTFTLYDNAGSTSDTIHPKKNSYTTSIWLGGSSSCGGSYEDRFQGNTDSCCE